MSKNKWLAIGIAVIVGLGAGFSVSLVDILKPYSALTGAITALIIAIIGILRKSENNLVR
jgi:hypothetical protein